MSDKVFLDCLGREIRVGDVLAYGYRVRNHGAIVLSIVRGFADNAINVTKLEQRGYAWRNNLRWEFADNRHITLPDQCFITGLTEDALKAMINLECEASQV